MTAERRKAALDERHADETESSLLSFVRENPVPLALIGAGLGLLLLTGSRRRSRYAQPDPAIVGRGGVYEDFEEDEQDDADPRSWDRTGTLGQLRERARDGVASARNAASDAAEHARQRVGDLEHHARAGAQRAKATAEQTLNERPLALAAVALGAGLVAGLSIPATESENQLVGRYRDQLFGSIKRRLAELESKAQEQGADVKAAQPRNGKSPGAGSEHVGTS